VARARLAPVDSSLLSSPVLASNQLSKGLLINGLINISAVGARHLQYGFSTPVDHLVSAHAILRPPQVSTIAGQVPRSLHPVCGKAVPHCGLLHPPLGKKLLEFDHSLSLVKGSPHVDNHSSSVYPVGRLGVSKKDPVHSTVHLYVPEYCGDNLHGVSLRSKLQRGPKLWYASKEEC
jgi:hypothetical protein